MNIIVRPYESELCYCRPDTTWEKESRDLYIPEGVDKVLWAPVVFAKVCKAGKCVSGKFVSRYYDAVGFGALVYCNDDNIAFSSCMDHTSILPMPLYNPVVFENGDNAFSINVGEKSLIYNADEAIRKALEETICKASERVSLRIGDMVALELSPLDIAAERNAGETGIKGKFCENPLFDLKVIF